MERSQDADWTKVWTKPLQGDGTRWPLGQAQEASTCLVSGLESVLLAQDWVCCPLGALSEGKKERGMEQRDGCPPFATLTSEVWTQA